MSYNRRKFLYTGASLMASGLAISVMGCNTSSNSMNTNKGKLVGDFGLQLYTLRDDLPKDPKGVLAQVAGMGYKQIEGYEGDKGMFWGMTNKEYKEYLNSLGLTMVSSHCDTGKDFERKAAEAAAIDMKYLISPWVGPQKKLDDFRKIADEFNRLGDICKKNGIRFAYHNHGYSFEKLEGQFPQDVLMSNTNPDTVDFEMDIYWVSTPGEDPEAWFKKYPNRFRLCHVKDRRKGAKPEEHEASCDLGTGSIPFAQVLKTAKEKGMQYFIVEQERYDNSTPLKSAAAGADYLKKLVI